MDDIRYLIDGKDLNSFGVFVSHCDGIIGRPKRKKTASVSWDDYHGEEVDLHRTFYESREIILSCFIEALGPVDFIEKSNNFLQIFDDSGFHRLEIVIDDSLLPYDVYFTNDITINKTWSRNKMVGTFRLKMIEPEPIKRVLKFKKAPETANACSISLTTQKLVNIFWGDGTVDEGIRGNSISIRHKYKKNGIYYPVIHGCIDEITTFDSNAETIWNQL